MKKGVEIALYTASGAVAIILTNQIVKYLNSGIGFLTTDRRMAKYAMTKPSGNVQPTTDAQWQEHYAWWKNTSKEYRKEWYKAVWRSEHGKPTPTYKADGKTWKTKKETAK